jgi:hypothetical protein
VELALADEYDSESSVWCNFLLLLAVSDLFGTKILTRAQVDNTTATDLRYGNTNAQNIPSTRTGS